MSPVYMASSRCCKLTYPKAFYAVDYKSRLWESPCGFVDSHKWGEQCDSGPLLVHRGVLRCGEGTVSGIACSGFGGDVHETVTFEPPRLQPQTSPEPHW